jgi:poly(A) polymerase
MKMGDMNYNQLIKVLKDINQNFKTVYIVGGILRDIMMTKKISDSAELDIDLLLYPLDISLLKKIMQKYKMPFIVLDEENKIYRSVIKTEEYVINLDFSTYEKFEDDILRRDFTINTLCLKLDDFIKYLTNKKLSIITQNLIDYTGFAIKDIKNKTLRVVSKHSFESDPLRILRLARFMCLGFKPEKKTGLLAVRNRKFLSNVAKERINYELKKIFNSSSYNVLEWMDKKKIIDEIIHEIKILKTKGKNTQFKKFYFHKEGLWQHVKLAYKSIEDILSNLKKFFPRWYQQIKTEVCGKEYILKYIVLFHDIGKPFVVTKEGDRVRFFHHEDKSAELAKKSLQKLKLANKEIQTIVNVITHHMRLGSLYNNKENLTERAYLRLFRDLEQNLVYLILFSLADRLSYEVIPIKARKKYIKNYSSITEFIKFENFVLQKYDEYIKKSKLPRLLTGYDVMNLFKIPEGPLVGKILNYVYDQQLLGKVLTKQHAVKIATDFLKTLKNK